MYQLIRFENIFSEPEIKGEFYSFTMACKTKLDCIQIEKSYRKPGIWVVIETNKTKEVQSENK